MSNEPRAGMNLDPEMLAAYIDKRLTPEQRAAVEAQLAKDPDSYAVLVESMKAVDALGESVESPPSNVSPLATGKPAGTKRWTAAMSVLAAAAVLAIAIFPFSSYLRSDDGIERLASVASNRRPTESRINRFPYGRRPVSIRSGGSPESDPALLSIAAEVRDRATGSSAPALHERGIALLILVAHDDSIAALRTAATQSPETAEYWSDLAAALLERSRMAASIQDARDAASASRRALSIDPESPSALFNLALALEDSESPTVASTAWDQYLRVDSSSPWADEARERLARLRPAPSPR